MKKAHKKSIVFGVISFAAALAVAACGGGDGTGSSTEGETKTPGSSSGTAAGSSGGSSSGSSGGSSSSSGGSSSGGSSSSSGSSGASSSSGGSSSGAVDAGYSVDAAGFKGCGKPGDKGNSIGVGKYCNGFSDCLGNSKAILCATLGDPNAHFCTNSCQVGDPSACGENATCTCQGSQCGCFPDACK